MLDPISDMLTRIRNAQRAGKKEASFPFSKIKLSIAKILEENNFIDSITKVEEEKHPLLRVGLKYQKVSNTLNIPAISGIKRVSRQGQRIYVKKEDIKRVKNGYGISLISTSKGLMTGEQARKNGLGGEVICEVW